MEENNIENNNPVNEAAESVNEAVTEVTTEAAPVVEAATTEATTTVEAATEAAADTVSDATTAVEAATETVTEATPVVETPSPVPSPTVNTAPAFEMPTTNRAVPTPKEKPSKGVNLLLVLAIAVVVIIAGIVVIGGNGKVIANTFNKLTMDSDKYCQTVLKNYVKSQAKDIANNYGDVSKKTDAKKYAYEASASVKFSEDALDVLDDNGIDDVDFLADSKATVRVDKNEDIVAIRATYGTEKKSVLSLNFIMDMEEELAFVQVPEINEQYLYADISDLLEQFSSEEYEDLFKNIDNIEKLSEDEIEDFINRYCNIIIESFEDVEEETVELKVDKVSTKVTSLTVELTEEDCKNIALEIIDALKDDETLEKYCDSYTEALDLDDDMWDEVSDELDYMYENLDNTDTNDENVLVLQFYVNNKGDICGFCSEVHNDDDDVVGGTAFFEITSGTKYALKYVVYEYDDDLFTFSGTGSKSLISGKISGVFTMEYEDVELDITLKNCKFGVREVSGTIEVAMEDIIEVLDTDELDDYEDYVLSLSFKNTTDELSYKFTILDGKNEFASVAFDFSSSSFKKVSVPDEKDCADMTDEDDLEDWVDEADVDDLNDALEDMGFPEDCIPDLKDMY